MFRYSGSKKRMLKHLPAPPAGTLCIVEPFAGSAAYGLHHRPDSLVLAEANSDVRGLWTWLSTQASEEDLREVERLRPSSKIDVRSLLLPKPQETLLRLMVSGAYVGQLSSWVLYPQHSLNLQGIVDALPYLRGAVQTPVLKDYRETASKDRRAGALFFVDPPYFGTEGNYHDKSLGTDMTRDVSVAAVTDFVCGLKSPVLLTYGSGAPELFPDFDWTLGVIRKVPILRGGGTRDHPEWYAKIRW